MIIDAVLVALTASLTLVDGAAGDGRSLLQTSHFLAGSGATDDAPSLDASTFTDSESAVWKPEFFAPQLTPNQFLIISSPSQAKVVYTQLRNFKSMHGRTFVLLDSGLGEPCGIAVDHDRGDLYVADRKAQKIFRYGLRVKKDLDNDGNEVLSLVTDANRLTIVSGRQVDWVTVAWNGDVFYSDLGTQSINKITASVMDRIAGGEIQAEDLGVVSEKQQEASAAASVANSLGGGAPQPSAEDNQFANSGALGIMSIYEGKINPRVSSPAGVASDGIRLYWANGASGLTSGSVVRGEVNPKPSPTLAGGSEPQPFPATALASNSNASFGVAKSNTMVFYSTTQDDSGVVFGVDAQQNDGNVYAFAQGLSSPRGLVWDGDNTVFVADEGASAVYSFPVGRLVEASPLTKAVEFIGPYGVAMLSEQDKAWALNPSRAAARGLLALPWFLALFSLILPRDFA